MAYNSTIRQRLGYCALCSDGVKKPLINKLCNSHYWMGVKLKSVAKMQEQEVEGEPGLPELVEEADVVFSRYIRLSAADGKGMVVCYTCGAVNHWRKMDCGHFIPRGNMYLRFDPKNVRPQCITCNRHRDGMAAQFGANLNKEANGMAETLIDQARVAYKLTREEVRNIIGEYTDKLKKITNGK